ncbi:hypothetical protein PSTEL_22060 [Paenibacillus stellifer]|uniref:Uncharacterized protein n=1 Tax=Paenibacillus stellifer TaxID=169760 RepID=A0A089LV77_9BACL|nr:hypothetical protein PSTEL_22060 [Paenibacillus stellifer]
MFAEIAEYAMQLGYKPKKSKTAAIHYVFTSSIIRKYLLKFFIQQGKPVLNWSGSILFTQKGNEP